VKDNKILGSVIEDEQKTALLALLRIVDCG
jgi:hypothetical protein